MAYLNVKNDSESKLAAAMLVGDLTLDVITGDGTKFPAAPFHISIENEILEVTAVATDTFTVTRAVENTTAVAHSVGNLVQLRITAGIIKELQALWQKLGTVVYYLGGRVGIGTSTPTATLHLKDSGVQMKMTDTYGALLTSGFVSEVGGQLVDFGTNFNQTGTKDVTYPGGYFRIDIRTAYTDQFFNITYIPAGAAELPIFKVSTTGDVVTTGTITSNRVGGNNFFRGNVGTPMGIPGGLSATLEIGRAHV